MIKAIFLIALSLVPLLTAAQLPSKGMFSLGVRSTHNAFSHDGQGLGVGGQFRIQLSDRVNTEWFADYISISGKHVRSNYAHIGWSVLFYLFKPQEQQRVLQPYISAGHCFDYNKKTAIRTPENTVDRWGSAVQGGIGTHLFVTDRFDVSISSLYMIHLTPAIESHTHEVNGVAQVVYHEHQLNKLEGHLLTTISINYKIGQLWGR